MPREATNRRQRSPSRPTHWLATVATARDGADPHGSRQAGLLSSASSDSGGVGVGQCRVRGSVAAAAGRTGLARERSPPSPCRGGFRRAGCRRCRSDPSPTKQARLHDVLPKPPLDAGQRHRNRRCHHRPPPTGSTGSTGFRASVPLAHVEARRTRYQTENAADERAARCRACCETIRGKMHRRTRVIVFRLRPPVRASAGAARASTTRPAAGRLETLPPTRR